MERRIIQNFEIILKLGNYFIVNGAEYGVQVFFNESNMEISLLNIWTNIISCCSIICIIISRLKVYHYIKFMNHGKMNF